MVFLRNGAETVELTSDNVPARTMFSPETTSTLVSPPYAAAIRKSNIGMIHILLGKSLRKICID
jgi:hypothetical protein